MRPAPTRLEPGVRSGNEATRLEPTSREVVGPAPTRLEPGVRSGNEAMRLEPTSRVVMGPPPTRLEPGVRVGNEATRLESKSRKPVGPMQHLGMSFDKYSPLIKLSIEPGPVVESGQKATISVYVSVYERIVSLQGDRATRVPSNGASVSVRVWRPGINETCINGTTDSSGRFSFKWLAFKLSSPTYKAQAWFVWAYADAKDANNKSVAMGGKSTLRMVTVVSKSELTGSNQSTYLCNTGYDPLAYYINKFKNYQPMGDGHYAISSLTSLDWYPQFNLNYDDPLVLILVNARLFPYGDIGGNLALGFSLINLQYNINNEGYRARIVKADIYPPYTLSSPLHKDGLIVLALRNFFIQMKAAFPRFQGVILVGNIPEALIWRTYKPYSAGDFLAYRADIVLADLSGNWGGKDAFGQPIYRQDKDCFFIDDYKGGHPFNIDNKNETPDPVKESKKDPEVGCKHRYLLTPKDFELPALCKQAPAGTAGCNLDLIKKAKERFVGEKEMYFDWRLGGSDGFYSGTKIVGLTEMNRMAIPDILVSRINAWHLAKGDLSIEKQLILEYLKRNSDYRTGGYKLDRRIAGISSEKKEDPVYPWKPDSPGDELAFREVPSDYLTASGKKTYGYTREKWASKNDYFIQASLLDFLVWLKDHPALLRSIPVHGDPRFLRFKDYDYSMAQFCVEAKGCDPGSYTGTVHSNAYEWFFKLIWERQLMTTQKVGAFYFTHACSGYTPHKSDVVSYVDPIYGIENPAECLLFYAKGLAVLAKSRSSKQAIDSFEVVRVLRAGYPFGEAWRANLLSDRRLAMPARENKLYTPDADPIRKYVYYWAVAGDWTLRINPPLQEKLPEILPEYGYCSAAYAAPKEDIFHDITIKDIGGEHLTKSPPAGSGGSGSIFWSASGSPETGVWIEGSGVIGSQVTSHKGDVPSVLLGVEDAEGAGKIFGTTDVLTKMHSIIGIFDEGAAGLGDQDTTMSGRKATQRSQRVPGDGWITRSGAFSLIDEPQCCENDVGAVGAPKADSRR